MPVAEGTFPKNEAGGDPLYASEVNRFNFQGGVSVGSFALIPTVSTYTSVGSVLVSGAMINSRYALLELDWMGSSADDSGGYTLRVHISGETGNYFLPLGSAGQDNKITGFAKVPLRLNSDESIKNYAYGFIYDIGGTNFALGSGFSALAGSINPGSNFIVDFQIRDISADNNGIEFYSVNVKRSGFQ